MVSGGAQKICDFPAAFKRTVSRPHHSVLSIVAAERRCLASALGNGSGGNAAFMENVSHGQLQSVSAVATENLVDGDKPPVYVCTPPQLMEGKGVVRKFEGDRVLVVPAHSGNLPFCCSQICLFDNSIIYFSNVLAVLIKIEINISIRY